MGMERIFIAVNKKKISCMSRNSLITCLPITCKFILSLSVFLFLTVVSLDNLVSTLLQSIKPGDIFSRIFACRL